MKFLGLVLSEEDIIAKADLTETQKILSVALASEKSRIDSVEYLSNILNEQLNEGCKRTSLLESYFNTSGQALKAVQLASSRTIWGRSFNGTANITGAMTGVASISMSGTLTGVTGIDSFLTLDANNKKLTIDGLFVPSATDTKNIGTSALRFNEIHCKTGYIDTIAFAENGDYTPQIGTTSGKMWFAEASDGYEFDNVIMAHNVLSLTDGTYSLGDASHRWKDLYLTGIINVSGADLYVDGDVWASDADQVDVYDMHASAFSQISDERKKDIISDKYLCLDEINSLRSVLFTFKGKTKEHVGTISQDVLSVLPQVVSADRNGYYSLDYGNLGVTLALSLGKIVKEQAEKIEQLESQVASLTEKLSTAK